jgi:hypothetical protein
VFRARFFRLDVRRLGTAMGDQPNGEWCKLSSRRDGPR